MKYNIDFPIAVIIFFGLGSILAVSTNDMYPPPLSRALLSDSEGRHGGLVVSMDIEKKNGKRFENTFIITIILRNAGSEPYSRDLGQPVFDIQTYDTNGSLVSEWSSCNEMLDLPIPIHLEKEEEFTEIKRWEPNALGSQDGVIGTLPPGRYYLKGTWLGGPSSRQGWSRSI